MSNEVKSKKSLLNLHIDTDLFESIKEKAQEKGFEKVSMYIQDWFYKLGLDKKDIKRVIFQIPENALKDKETLEIWLMRKSNEIISQYFPTSQEV